MNTYDVILKSVVTEKASRGQETGKYTFAVRRDCTKVDIKNAIKVIYGADVATVRTSILPGKVRLLGRNKVWTKRDKYKKAIVTLKGKKTIDPNKIKEVKN